MLGKIIFFTVFFHFLSEPVFCMFNFLREFVDSWVTYKKSDVDRIKEDFTNAIYRVEQKVVVCFSLIEDVDDLELKVKLQWVEKEVEKMKATVALVDDELNPNDAYKFVSKKFDIVIAYEKELNKMQSGLEIMSKKKK